MKNNGNFPILANRQKMYSRNIQEIYSRNSRNMKNNIVFLGKV